MKKIFQIIILLFTLSIIYPANNYSLAKNLDNQKVTLYNKTNKSETTTVTNDKKEKSTSKKDTQNSTNKAIASKKTVSSQKNSNENVSSKNNKESKKESNEKETDSTKNASKPSASKSNNNSSNSSQLDNTEIDPKEMTPSDWKISVDSNEINKDFNSIHNTNPTINSLNDGHFLLILGIVLVILSIAGVTIFSILLIKNKKQNS